MKLRLIEQLILEDRLDFLANQLGNKLVAALQTDTFASQKFGDEVDPKSILNDLQSADPTGKYLQWIARQYANQDFKLEDLRRVEAALKQFTKKKAQLPIKDIGQYKHLSDLEDAVDDPPEVKAKRQKVETTGIDVIAKGPDATIISPKTEEAACYYGEDTRWCTAYTGERAKDNMFKSYNSRGPLYVVLGNDGRKFQLHFETLQFMDEKDRPVNFGQLIGKYPSIANIPSIEYEDLGNKQYSIKIQNGNKFWYKDGKIHREDGPAVEFASGTKMWYKDGMKHREDRPAAEFADGSKQWYKDGKLHREDGPATELADGTKKWYKDGELHREDGPAIEWASGEKYWYKDGQLHREDGPAAELSRGRKGWWLNGQAYWDEKALKKALEQYYKDNKQ